MSIIWSPPEQEPEVAAEVYRLPRWASMVFALGVLLMLAGLATAANAQNISSNPQGGELAPDWSNVFRIGHNSYSDANLNDVLAHSSRGAAQPGVTFDNGYAPGSLMNSGILSTKVPDGGPVVWDTSELQKSWGPSFARAFTWVWQQGLPVALVIAGLALGMRFVFIWFTRWGA